MTSSTDSENVPGHRADKPTTFRGSHHHLKNVKGAAYDSNGKVNFGSVTDKIALYISELPQGMVFQRSMMKNQEVTPLTSPPHPAPKFEKAADGTKTEIPPTFWEQTFLFASDLSESRSHF